MADYGLVGEKLPHSFSPQIHNMLWSKNYELIELNRAEAIDFFKNKNFKGVNVTIPYKELAKQMCDLVEDNADRIGCVNTVIHAGGMLYGANTDYMGFKYCLFRADIHLKDKNVLILGTGATSKTADIVAYDMEAKSVEKVSRTGELNYTNIYDRQETQVIINTTPVGMFPNINESLVDLSRFKNLEAVVDVVYNPLKTKLVADAESLGLKATGGLPMLVAQAVFSAKYFAKKDFGRAEIENILLNLQKSRQNIVLIGMPGCGKSTIGGEISEKLNREFFDTDKIIEEKEKMSIPEIFEKFGEEHFRTLESETVKSLASKTGCVIACGGGTPLNKSNAAYLKTNGKLYCINRDTDKLPTSGRPLSVNLEKLAAERLPIYEAIADNFIDNNQSIEKAVEELIEKL